jgi:hypothetical protein
MTGAGSPSRWTEQAETGAVFGAFVKEQLEAERKRRETLDQRGSETAKTTGRLLTLVVGFAALILGVEYRPQSRPERNP